MQETQIKYFDLMKISLEASKKIAQKNKKKLLKTRKYPKHCSGCLKCIFKTLQQKRDTSTMNAFIINACCIHASCIIYFCH